MKRKIEAVAFALLFAICVTAFSLTSLGGAPASANSAMTYFEGVDSSGVLLTTEDCPIVVDSEELTFDIQIDKEKFNQYDCGGKVTAKYAFRNPADYTADVGLLFPIGFVCDEPDEATKEYMNITVNGDSIDKRIRYSYKVNDGNYNFNYSEDVKLLSDECIERGKYDQDLEVYKYVCDVHSTGRAVRFYLSNYDGIAVGNATKSEEQYGGVLTFELDEESDTADKSKSAYYKRVTVYFIGADIGNDMYKYSDVDIDNDNLGSAVRYYDTMSFEKERTGSVRIVSQDRITYFDMIKEMSDYSAISGISDIDLHNAIVAKHNNSKSAWRRDNWTFDDYMDLGSDLICWYEYDLSFAPGETIINEVTAPLYPDVDYNYKTNAHEDNQYTYNYFLSPAKTWKSFGSLKITINTSLYMIKPSLDGFEKYDGYYEYVGNGLPNGELKFTVTAKKPTQKTTATTNTITSNIQMPKVETVAIVFAVVAFVVILVIILINLRQ